MDTQDNISADFPFQSRYAEILGSEMHYIDEGTGDPILFLHGNPTSSYLWRNILPHLTPFARCIALDLIGMGRSDKPDIGYGFFDHVEYVEGFIQKLNLQGLTLVIHDWGSALGFYYAMRHEANVKAIAFMEFVHLLTWQDISEPGRRLFKALRTPEAGKELIFTQNVFIEQILFGSPTRELTEEEKARYREPFLDPATRLPMWRWPNELPIDGEPADIVVAVAAYHDWLLHSDLPKLLLYGSPGAFVPPTLAQWHEEHLRNVQLVSIGAGSHYLQEENPHRIGSEIVNWYRSLNE